MQLKLLLTLSVVLSPNCSAHNDVLEHLCSQLTNCLIRCADCSIPKRGGKYLAGWNDEVKSLKENSIWNVQDILAKALMNIIR